MSLEEQIVTLLHEKIGFNPASVGAETVLASVRVRLNELRIQDPVRFFNGLRQGNQDFHDLVDAVIIPETWFFRDGKPFDCLKRHVIEDWRQRPKTDTLRCLSLPCSTGEEPYTIAMSLIDAGLDPDEFSIDGVDISGKSLERAKAAAYGAYSFRGDDISYRDRYFEKRSHDYLLKSDVRKTVNFSKGNLLDPAFMNDFRQYDIIFCRNLLIYFDPPSWTIAIGTLHRLLKDSGLLFMGHAEMLELTAPQFESIRIPGAFAYRKRRSTHRFALYTPPPRPATRKSRKFRVERPSVLAGPAKPSASAVAPRPAVIKPVAAAKKEQAPALEHAQALADKGHLAPAASECERVLAREPHNAAAHFLLGVVREAAGNVRDAEQHYTRALYLDSKHQEAMIHLALLAERRGDTQGAVAFRRRAERVRQTS